MGSDLWLALSDAQQQQNQQQQQRPKTMDSASPKPQPPPSSVAPPSTPPALVLYDDGDLEVLCLDKEHRELIHNGHKPTKKSKPSKGSPHKELNSPSKIRGKRTPRKNLKHVQKGAPKSKTTSELLEADSRGSPGISDPEHAEMHKHDDMNSGHDIRGYKISVVMAERSAPRAPPAYGAGQRLMQFASTKMCERIDIPQISLGILNGMVKSDFPNEKSHAQWKKRQ